MESEIIYREVPKADKNQYRRLFSEVMEAMPRKDFFVPPENFTDNIFLEDYALNTGAYHGDTLVAIATLMLKPNPKYKKILGVNDECFICELGNLLVTPAYRGRGIMQKLFQMSLESAKRLKVDILMATVHPENIKSLKILEKEMAIAATFDIEEGNPRLMLRKTM